MRNFMMIQATDESVISRRKLLTALGAISVLASVDIFASSASAREVDRFLQLSSNLTGFEVQELNSDRARQLLGWIMASGYSDSLGSALEAPSLTVDDELAEVLITAWYGGVIAVNDVPFVDTYTDALAWKAAWFATPRTVCSTVPNDWALSLAAG